MRLPPVLSPVDLPEPELIAALKDGDLQMVGGAYCSVDAIIGYEHRALSVNSEVPTGAIVEQLTAAWIYGAVLDLLRPLQLCVDAQSKVHPISTRTLRYREVVIGQDELRSVGTLRMTSPLRTAVDLARFSREFTEWEDDAVRRLATSASFTLEDCARSMNARRNLPNKRMALHRLASALALGDLRR